MMVIFDNEFATVSIFQGSEMVQVDWTLKTADMSGDGFKEVLLKVLAGIEKYKPKFYLANTKLFEFPVSPELQEWSNEHFLLKIGKLGIEKFAIVISSEFIAQLSIEQTMEENPLEFDSKYFDEVQKAYSWLGVKEQVG